MPLTFGLYIKKLKLSKQLQSKKGLVFSRACDSSQRGNNNKSVHFSDSTSTVYYTYSSNDYDRGSFDIGDMDMVQQLGTNITIDLDAMTLVNDGVSDMDYDRTQQEVDFDDQCRRNTNINKKRGHYSIAVLVHYRSNF